MSTRRRHDHPATPQSVRSLKDAVAALRVEHRERIHAAARWSLADGRPVPMEHVALIIAAMVHLGERLDGGVQRDEALLLSVMTVWCREQRVDMPAAMRDSLTTYLDFLRHG
ncbi:MAG: hypothetical protein QOG87_2325 [Actinomycetota bacterium]|jgi:hypothetical protein